MSILVVGCSFRTAPLEVRERLAFDAEAVERALAQIAGSSAVAEGLVLSTCNRVELYGVGRVAAEAEQELIGLLVERSGVPAEELLPVLYRLADDEALAHIFRVTASLDAMVVGEAQITGQVKDAFAAASGAGTVGPLLSRCMQRAFLAAKRARTETGIARFPASVSSVAVELASRVFEDLATVATLVVGAGQMAELAVRHLLGHGVSRLHVANRSPERAACLCAEFGAKAVGIDCLLEQLAWADVVLCSTGSPEPIIGRDQLATVMRRRKQRPLVLIDIAVPRDVDPRARSLANVYLFDVDDLERVVAENIRARRKEARTAERIVAAEVEQFKHWLRAQRAVPVIKLLREHFVDVARGEAERAAKRLGLNGGPERAALDHMAEAIVNKLLHAPTMELKRAVDESHGPQLAAAAKQLFSLAAEEQPAEGDPDGTPQQSE